jgi:hypothetical protein
MGVHVVAAAVVPVAAPTLPRCDMFVTGRCTLKCAQCSQREFRADHGDMELSVAKKVVDDVRKSGRKMILSLTGGEPTLWPHLIEFLKYSNGVFAQIWLYTNGHNSAITETAIKSKLVTKVVSNIANAQPGAISLASKYPTVVKIDNGGHRLLSRKVAWNSLPAECNCMGFAVQGSTVWPCPNMYSLAKRHGFDMDFYRKEFSCPVSGDWLAFVDNTERKKFGALMCAYCDANRKVQRVRDAEKSRSNSRGI